MKKAIIIFLLALLGMTQALAQEYEYVPFVREGVKWVYCCKNPFWEEDFWGQQYFSFEMKNDVLIGDKSYKPVQLTHYLDENGSTKEVEEYTPVYLREEDKMVYAFLPDGIIHPQCPVGMFSCIAFPADESPITTTNQEFKLYDFNNPTSLYGNLVEYDGMSMVTIGNHMSKCHRYIWDPNENDVIIEGIGYDGNAGMPLFYFEYFVTGFQVTYGLCHVIENGEIIYKGKWYKPDIHVSIDEVVTDQLRRPEDPQYYNLMGQPMGKDVPTTPGIYIKGGQKIVVR